MLSSMNNYLNRRQNIIVSCFLLHNNKVLVVRTTSMIEIFNDTEYYDIPTWRVSFGDDPLEKVKSASMELFDTEQIEELVPVKTYSFLHFGETIHTVGIVYRMKMSKVICENIEECEHFNFIRIEDIDSYIFSTRIKNIISEIWKP